MGQVILGPAFSKGSGSKTLDPRLLSIMSQAAALSPYNVVFQQGVAARSTGTINHPNGWAMDVQLQDPSTGKLLPNDGPAAKPYFKQYEQLAQTARVVQQQAYPELNNTFRWGGPWAAARGNPSGSDFEHFDINPGGKLGGGVTAGSMDSYTWDHGFGGGGLNANKDFVNQVQSQYAQLQKGLLPPGSIPNTQVASAAHEPSSDPLSAFNNVGSVAKSSALNAINAEAPPPLPIPRPVTSPPSAAGAGDMLAFNPQPTGTAPVPGWEGMNYPWDGQTLSDGNPSIPMDAGLNANGQIVPIGTPNSMANFNGNLPPPGSMIPPYPGIAATGNTQPYAQPSVAATGNTEPYSQPLVAATGNTQPYTPIGANGSGVAMPASGPMGNGSAAVQMPPSAPTSLMDDIHNFLQGPYNARVASGAPDLQTVLQAPYKERVAAGQPNLGAALEAPYNQSHMTKHVGPNVNALTEAQKLALIAPANYHESLNLPPSGFGLDPSTVFPTGSGAAKLPSVAAPPLPRARPLTPDSLLPELYPNGVPKYESTGPLPDVPSWAIPSAPYTLTLPQPGSSNTIVNGAINGAVRNIVPTLPLGQAAGLGRAIFGGSQSSPMVAPPMPFAGASASGSSPSYHSSPVSQTPPSAYPMPFAGASASGGTNYSAPPQPFSGSVVSGGTGYTAPPPPLPIPRPAYVPPTITKQVLNPAYTQWQAQQPAAWDPIVSGADTGMSWATQNTGDPSNPFSSFASVANRPPAPQQFLTRTVPNPNYVAPPLAYPTGGNFLAGKFNGSTVGKILSLFGGGQNAADMVFGGINQTGLTPQGTPGTFLPHLTAPAPLTVAQHAVSTPEYIAAVNAGQSGYTPAGSNMLMPTTTISGGFRQNYGDSGSGSLASRG